MLIRFALVAIVTLTFAASGAPSTDCADELLNVSGCTTVTTEVGDDGVDLFGTEHTGDGEKSADIERGVGDRDGVSTGVGSAAPPCVNPDGSECRSPIIATITSPVTLRDIASFRPTASVSHSQPNGWTIAGLDTNLYSTGAQHVVDGVLLGQPASVRFTPVAWNWSYGDGNTATRDVPGTPWPSRADEFNPTPTSHIYRDHATFTITLTVDYAAEYRYAAGPWVPIAGTLRVPANDLDLTVGSAKTVLVNENCDQNPRGPGC